MAILILKILVMWWLVGVAAGLVLGAIIRRAERVRTEEFLTEEVWHALYTSIGNVLDQHYQGGSGYPSLPFNFRAGIKLTIGGEAWKRR